MIFNILSHEVHFLGRPFHKRKKSWNCLRLRNCSLIISNAFTLKYGSIKVRKLSHWVIHGLSILDSHSTPRKSIAFLKFMIIKTILIRNKIWNFISILSRTNFVWWFLCFRYWRMCFESLSERRYLCGSGGWLQVWMYPGLGRQQLSVW